MLNAEARPFTGQPLSRVRRKQLVGREGLHPVSRYGHTLDGMATNDGVSVAEACALRAAQPAQASDVPIDLFDALANLATARMLA
jgi:hypothetical protein